MSDRLFFSVLALASVAGIVAGASHVRPAISGAAVLLTCALDELARFARTFARRIIGR